MTIRPFREQDRGRLLAMLGERRAIDSPGHRLQVLEAPAGSAEPGAVAGVALWVAPDAGDEGYLGLVALRSEAADERGSGRPPPTPAGTRWVEFYRLVAACARDATRRGLRRGYFTVRDGALLRRIQRDFDVQPEPSGWDPATREAVQWDIHVDLEDALRQLERVT